MEYYYCYYYYYDGSPVRAVHSGHQYTGNYQYDYQY